MDHLQKLINDRSALLARCGILAKEIEKRSLTAAEEKEYKQKLDDAQSLRVQIEEIQAYRNENGIQPDGSGTRPQRRPDGGGTGRQPGNELREFGTFLQDVARAGVPGGQVTEELQSRSITGMGETVGSDGGFLVGTDQSTDLLQKVYSGGAIASRVRRLPPLRPGTNGIKLPTIDETSRATGSRLGGVRTYWGAEGDAPTGTKPKIGELELKLKRLTGLAYVTEELLEDAEQLASVLMDSFTKEMRFAVEDSIIRGTGAGMPLGWLNSPAKVSVAKEASQANYTIVFQNVAKMLARLHPASWKTAVWLANVSCLPQLLQLSIPTMNIDSTENVGGAGLAYNPNTRQLLGIPVEFVEQCEAVGTVGDLVLVDNNEYLMIDKAMQGASSIHVRFSSFERAFRWIYRCDGQPAWKQELTPYKGTDTVSPCVVLASRS